MTHPVRSVGSIKLEEGTILLFKVLSMVNLQDSRDYYILEDPNGMKHFIDAEVYANYGIQTGSKIKCEVVKINCTGRIILEPFHPIYKEGQSYYFNLVSFDDGEPISRVILEDIFKNKIELQVAGSPSLNSKPEKFIKCKVIRLKKGIPEIEIVHLIWQIEN